MKNKLISFILALCLLIAIPLETRYKYNPFTRKLDYYETGADIDLGDLADVTLTGLATGNVLYYDGSAWVNLATGANTQFLTLAEGIPAWQAIPAGVTTFVGLNDTPANYAGSNSYMVRVNAGADALVFGAEGDIDHDGLTNWAANKHVVLPNTLVNVLSDHNLLAHTTLGLFDQSSDVDHDLTTNYVAAQHRNPANVFYISATGGDYTTIQAALNAQTAGGETFLVGPGTYTDTISFTANNQVVKALGRGINVIVTQADANIVDAGIFTDCRVEDIGIRLTAPTTAINAVQVGTGELTMVDCTGYLATAVALVQADQPSLVGFTGAGDINIRRGRYEYYHTGNTGEGGIKAALRVNVNLAELCLHKVDAITVTNSGTALATVLFITSGTAVTEIYNCINGVVTDPNATLVVGLGYVGGGGAHNVQGNHVDVIATDNTSYGLYHDGTATIRSSYNAIHAFDTGGASYAFYVGASATLNSHFDDLRSDDGNAVTGTLILVSSEIDGYFTLINAVDEFSTDGTLAGNSDIALPTEKAVKTYVDGLVTAQDLDFAGNAGTGAVDLDSQTFTFTGTDPIDTAALNQVLTISHKTTDGYKHIPSGGASAQMLQYTAAGTAKWITVSSGISIADGGVVTVANDSHTHVKTNITDTPWAWTDILYLLEDHVTDHNVAVGYLAGQDLATGGQYNTLVGEQAGLNVTIGDENTFLGYQTGFLLTDRIANVFIGTKAGYGSEPAEADQNVGIGREALYSLGYTGQRNVAIGDKVAHALTDGQDNVAVGFEAMYGQVGEGGKNTFVGASSGYTGGAAYAENVGVGYQALYSLTSGTRNIAIGNSAGYELTTATYNVFIGHLAGGKATTVGGYDLGNTAVGAQASFFNVVGIYNVAIGKEAGYGSNDQSHSENVFVGYRSGFEIKTATANTFVGAYAGYTVDEGSNNVGIGHKALYANGPDSDTVENVAVGVEALYSLGYAGGRNTAVGYKALRVLDSESRDNVAVGWQAGGGLANDTQANIFIGSNAGYGTALVVEGNVIIGHQAGEDISGGDYNVIIGYMAGEGWMDTESNKLVIANTDTETPLIYGEFDTSLLKFTATNVGVVGITNLGDGGVTNYASFAADGTLTLAGTARTINAVWVDAGGIAAPATNPATLIAHGLLETPAWRFGDVVEGLQENVAFNMRVPNRMDRGVAPTITIGWSADGVSPGNCRWQLEYLWTSPGENTAAGAQETLPVTGTATATANGLVLTTFTGIDIPSATDTCLHCRITRLSADVLDTITDDVELHGVCLSWTSDKLGT